MSVERSLEAWEEVQRHGQDLADRLAQGFTGLIHINPPSFPWPPNHHHYKAKLFDLEFPSQHFSVNRDSRFSINQPINGVSAILDIGNKIGQAGVDFGAGLNVMVQQFFRSLPIPFLHEDNNKLVVSVDGDKSTRSHRAYVITKGDLGLAAERLRDSGFSKTDDTASVTMSEEEVADSYLRTAGLLGRSKGTIDMSSSYDSRTNGMEHSLAARGDLWRVEASHSSSTASDGNSSLFLLQLGPLLFLRDSTLLLPLHLSKQHLLWYGYDRKKGMHSLCPALWSKHRRWLMMSMLSLNPLACSFMDLQFPNGQLTYVSGEGLTTSAFVPFCGGLLQAQGQYPGDMRFSYSCKNKCGTRITPMVHWPDKSFALDLSQPLAWRRAGLLMKPTIQVSVCPTFGGSNPGLKAEVIHSLSDDLNLICGYALNAHPSAFASVSFGRSKWNGNIGRTGIVVRADTPLASIGQPSFSVQLNNAFEF
ncbi:unnamed protein product [Arabidopsis lyrata]|uniref:Uncharacterized protein n=1 Tax=Arabidopsis lyrata subsp. lyrata TaxID=81972 RepID=D7L377_ARALL|nr:uncharacterized protein LOC9318961 [Arabidopsis lyrata subsp. lyrata]XP_020888807.1 uncharacterized protein LOC9318961 [Arabidopsis lyrata subsp. lyrata]XP_020888808.1 uncharacterized protein LOC9318961 [Arabidopsis lyrata subsp. lyrata]XP_020888809.1 uncharacterized protein LOC9318961 [Arabidopsis lyrata subsp. lyrata]XP_020888810.1 uncharacterized protein LOC9318961 [Arabidopsis lyrata subsp. lyrata]XP_020888811.1 uncharacterized protein LOC9318961 [Arabidopsis lyrata subsp. lyrata]XP_02|eukprot:XP_020888806.1 uncharacterized protein LOC9318961 [Arabidopsis lyrata subsp. lyrata]